MSAGSRANHIVGTEPDEPIRVDVASDSLTDAATPKAADSKEDEATLSPLATLSSVPVLLFIALNLVAVVAPGALPWQQVAPPS